MSSPGDSNPTERSGTGRADPVSAVEAPLAVRGGEPKATVALTLGSGGARGYAHIGAIEVLEERGYDIIAVSGCSMGALVGGIYAAGKLQEYKDWVTGLGQFDVIRLLDLTFNSSGAIRGDKVFSIVRDILGKTRIEDLPIAYTAVATDLLGHKEVWFQEGLLEQAIRASVAIPGLVKPLVLNNRVLVDGALLNPLPIIPTISAHADLAIAVNLSGENERFNDLQDAAFERPAPDEGDARMDSIIDKASRWFDWDVLRTFGSRRDSNREGASDDPADKISRAVEDGAANNKGPVDAVDEATTINWDQLGIGRFDVMNLAIDTMQSALVQYKIAGYPPDLLVNLPKNACRTYDYHKAPELVQLGRERMSAALDRFEHDRGSHDPVAG
ncbi:patatin-like phospholipase family protein [Marinobacter sp. X15-166B]|uniref:patatin-like phospholipase family protein n=1 Tax=Marinobacter sp. X15-166B TaxID=1897620 RepID=UPI0009F54C39|nr:patatin-like phospholipase family protein [Marinobacter sp. X15-166B]